MRTVDKFVEPFDLETQIQLLEFVVSVENLMALPMFDLTLEEQMVLRFTGESIAKHRVSDPYLCNALRIPPCDLSGYERHIFAVSVRSSILNKINAALTGGYTLLDACKTKDGKVLELASRPSGDKIYRQLLIGSSKSVDWDAVLEGEEGTVHDPRPVLIEWEASGTFDSIAGRYKNAIEGGEILYHNPFEARYRVFNRILRLVWIEQLLEYNAK